MDLLSANLSEDLPGQRNAGVGKERGVSDCVPDRGQTEAGGGGSRPERRGGGRWQGDPGQGEDRMGARDVRQRGTASVVGAGDLRSEEHTSNSSHLGISYAVFCLKKKRCPRRHRQSLRRADWPRYRQIYVRKGAVPPLFFFFKEPHPPHLPPLPPDPPLPA